MAARQQVLRELALVEALGQFESKWHNEVVCREDKEYLNF
jgi:hypothetical protein